MAFAAADELLLAFTCCSVGEPGGGTFMVVDNPTWAAEDDAEVRAAFSGPF
jgi:hypothetical protein